MHARRECKADWADWPGLLQKGSADEAKMLHALRLHNGPPADQKAAQAVRRRWRVHIGSCKQDDTDIDTDIEVAGNKSLTELNRDEHIASDVREGKDTEKFERARIYVMDSVWRRVAHDLLGSRTREGNYLSSIRHLFIPKEEREMGRRERRLNPPCSKDVQGKGEDGKGEGGKGRCN